MAAVAIVLQMPAAPVRCGTGDSGSAPFVLEDNRVYVELPFILPNGQIRKAWTFLDIGTPDPVVSSALYRDLQLDRQAATTFRIGDLQVQLKSNRVVKSDWLYNFRKGTEFILPGSLIHQYQVEIDYPARTLTFALPGTLRPSGIAVPCLVNDETGSVSVGITAAGTSYRAAIDIGSAYTWFSERVVDDWLQNHPGWERGVGAVGESNMQMMAWWGPLYSALPHALGGPRVFAFLARHLSGHEARGILLRLPEIQIGSVRLQETGVLGVAHVLEMYSRKTPGPVAGWIGGNVLKNFRLTIDSPRRVTYWDQAANPDPHDLDQVGLTLLAIDDDYFVGGVAIQNGKATVDGIRLGDRLVRIDSLPVRGASREAVLSAMHGSPGEMHTIVVDRNGDEIVFRAPVTGF